MAATVEIQRFTGASPGAGTTITSTNTVGQTDDAHIVAVGSSQPIQIPAGADNYGFWVSTRLNATVAPTTNITNLRWYTGGTNNLGTGVDMFVSPANVGADAGYRQATGTVGTTGTQLTTGNHGGLTGAPVSAFGFDSGSPLPLAGSTTGTGVFGDFVVYQFIVANTASPGPTPVPAETITWAFDES